MAKKIKHRKKRLPPIQELVDSEPTIELNENPKGAFSGWPMALCWLAMLIFTFHACTHMVAAGDTWVAMACGRHFVNHGVDTVEPFSANSHEAGPTSETMMAYAKLLQKEATGKDGLKYSFMRWFAKKAYNFENWPNWLKSFTKWIHPTGWVNQNWLTHVIFYSLVPKSSYADGVSFSSNALVYWKFTVYIITVMCVYFTSRFLGVNPVLAAVFSCFALFIGRSFIDVRPAGFSNMLVAMFLFILALSTYRNVLYIWLIVPLIVFWCNVHGGYVYAFIMLIPFIGLHLLISCNRKWTAIIYNVTAWPFLLIVLSRAGFTISTFLFTALLIILDFLLIFGKKNLVSIGFRGVCHTVAASAVAFIASILFNPFHLTNLTHTFVISVSKHAERWRDIHEWHPAFDWKNPVGTAIPFLIMYIMAWLILGFLIIILIRKILSVDKDQNRRKETPSKSQIPKIDFPIFVIGILTIYMALRSRRFIPIAGIAACPLIAFVIQELVRYFMSSVSIRKCGNVTSSLNECVYSVPKIGIAAGLIIMGIWQLLLRRWLFYPIPNDPEGRLQPRIELFVLGVFLAYLVVFLSATFWPIKRNGQKTQTRDKKKELIFSYITLGAKLTIFAFVIGFGLWFTAKFKQVYLDPWPNDPKLNSVFMRMTASDAKPFYAMKYIRDNKMSGKMFNYWTEGGFIAWGQEPDPNTGKTSLQLFMDGRAQAAYDRQTFDEWSRMIGGGPVTYQKLMEAQARKQSDLSPDDYREIGNWLDEQLRSRDVWVVMMPSGVYNDPDRTASYHTMRSLEYNANWRLVFFNDRQRIFVDINTPQGLALFEGIFRGTTLFPDDFHKNLVRAHSWLLYLNEPERRKEGLVFAIEAFNETPSPAAMLEIMVNAASYPELKNDVKNFCESYVDRFKENKEKWLNEDGFRLKVESTRLASVFMERFYRGNMERESFYADMQNECLGELKRINQEKRW